MTINFLDRGEGRIAYTVRGEGPLVICLPGMGELRSVYRFTEPVLVDAGYRVAVLDLRGHGDSDDGFRDHDDEALASDALALVDHLGGPAFLVGNSMGGSAAILAAAAEPTKVTGLALLGAFVRDPKLNPVMGLAMRLLLLKPWGPAAWRMYLKTLYPGRPPADQAEHLAEVAASFRRGDHWRSFVKTTKLSHAVVEGRLDAVRAPALVVMGEKDPDFTDPAGEARYTAERLGGELMLVPNSGHYPMTEYPELVNPALVAFVNRISTNA
ncbi:alpha/beta fold hydrolase [Micromonospora sp. NBC_01796]|uniref:alpha/beta fold hydrolase n=1 Tax=Micromonospora sp. NBC_01796 TaxID=2975987 RepID=UPI002DD998CB|nr:alpha/beta hydrolase [Micromonospora sp. NBC_01796]WSA88587.1 alpha/beta hydrolase [Micromonospora sp. NBC_01796]